jgi:hypothetical protein
MGRGAAAVLAALCVLAAAGAGRAAAAVYVPPINWGVADDASKYADDGGLWFDGMLAGADLTENRWTLAWDPSNPTAIDELPFIERAAPVAQAEGITIVLALYSKQASQHHPAGFCAWAATVANTVEQWGINDFIVWNEPNTRLYWVPQKDAAGNDVAAAAYEQLLATCYDTLHAADPEARVIGMGLSPRASTTESTEPLVFLRDVGAAYRRSGRTKPIMDQLSIHPYPNPSSPTDSPDVGYRDPERFGIPNLDRVKQAVYDAFNGTGQPTTLNGLTFRIDEVGWQTDTSALPQYINPENVAVVSEQTQANYLEKMATTYFACDPTVTDVELFLLVDEQYRNGKDATGKVVGGGWQSGLLTAGGEGVSEPKLAYTQDGAVFGEGREACAGLPTSWSPAAATGTTSSVGVPGTTAVTAGGLDGVVDPAREIELESALANLARTESTRPALPPQTAAQLTAYFQRMLTKLLAAGGLPDAPLTGTAAVVACTNPTTCTPSSALTRSSLASTLAPRASSAGYAIVRSGRATLPADLPMKLTLKAAARSAKVPAAAYYLVVVLKNQADASQAFALAVQARSVRPAKKTPSKKMPSKTTP